MSEVLTVFKQNNGVLQCIAAQAEGLFEEHCKFSGDRCDT